MKWFTSDTHYSHANIIRYSNRPHADIKEMNNALINNWNSVVKPNDEVYHLGDFAFAQPGDVEHILRRLNGQKFLIWGNHDKVLMQNKHLQQYFGWCRDYKEIKIQAANGDIHPTVLCHYAMLVWNKSHHGSFMLHGHSHGSLVYPKAARIMDVGVDPQNYFPISEHEVCKRLLKIDPPSFDHHGS